MMCCQPSLADKHLEAGVVELLPAAHAGANAIEAHLVVEALRVCIQPVARHRLLRQGQAKLRLMPKCCSQSEQPLESRADPIEHIRGSTTHGAWGTSVQQN